MPEADHPDAVVGLPQLGQGRHEHVRDRLPDEKDDGNLDGAEGVDREVVRGE